jgi:hypothetical protein
MAAPEPNSNKDKDESQIPESQLTEYVLANRRLADLGLTKDKGTDGEASYRYSINLVAMLDSVKVFRNHLSKTPDWFQADIQIKLFKLVRDMDSFENMWRPSLREDAKLQLLKEEDELTSRMDQRVTSLQSSII